MKGFTGGSVVNNLPSNAGNTSLILGPDFPGGSEGKESTCNAGDLSSISGLGRWPGGGHGNPLQYSCLENTMHRGAWWAILHGVAKSRTRLSNFTSKGKGEKERYTHLNAEFQRTARRDKKAFLSEQ